MKVKGHRAFGDFRRRIARHAELMQPWRGAVYRVTSLDYPDPKSILLGQGSFIYGGRWNAAGSFRAVYGSTTEEVAVTESRANTEYAGLLEVFRAPRLLVTLELDLVRVVDLTNLETLAALGVTVEELRAEDWRSLQNEGEESLTQCLGRVFFESGGNGVLAPSAKVPGGVNVVYFPENHVGVNQAKVFEPEKLERIKGMGD